MEPKLIDGKWFIEVFTEDFGNVLLLNPYTEMVTPIQFETETEAFDYINQLS